MATTKQQSIRFTDDDVVILEEIQRRHGLFRLSDAVRVALHHYAKAEGIDIAKVKAKKKR